ncbi:MAG: hypothetical protein RLZZ337_1401 [Bacteroidota bacterium]
MIRKSAISFISVLLLFGCSSRKALISSELTYEKRKVFDQQFFEANKQKVLNNKEKALGLFNEALETYPQSSAAMYETAKLHYQLENYNEALFWAKKAVESASSFNHWYSGQLAQFYNKFGKYAESAGVFSTMIENEPDVEDNYLEAANQYYNAKQFGDAIAVLLKMQDRFGVDEQSATRLEFVYRNMGEGDKAIDAIIRLVLAYPDETRYQGYLADSYLRANKEAEAKQVLSKMISADSSNGKALFMLYTISNKQGTDEDAFFYLKKAFASDDVELTDKLQSIGAYFLKLNKDEKTKAEIKELSDILVSQYPNSPEPWVLKSDISSALANYSEARDFINKALDVNHGDFKLWMKLLKIDEKLRKNRFLVEDADRALILFPNIAELYRTKAYALYHLSQYDKSIAVCDEGLEVAIEKQDKVSLKMCKALNYNKLNKYSMSNNLYNEVLSLDNLNPIALNNYAYNLASRGDRILEADSMINLALKLELNNPILFDTKAWVLYQQQKYEEALDWLNKAIAIDPNNKEYYVHSKAVYQKLGNLTLANEMQKIIDQLSIEVVN